MRQLYPVARDVDPADLYDDPRRRRPAQRPYVFVNMVTSADGGTVVDGRTERLGNEGDRFVFGLLRSLADGILVGAQTVRAEQYGAPRVRPPFRAARAARGQQELPRVAVVSRSLELDFSSGLFGDERSRPFVLAPADADPARLEQAQQHAEVIAEGAPELDLPAALRRLAEAGIASLLCEGGPTLNAALLRAGVVDELCLTVAPLLLGEDGGRRIMDAAPVAAPVKLALAHVLEDEGHLFLRYLTDPDGR